VLICEQHFEVYCWKWKACGTNFKAVFIYKYTGVNKNWFSCISHHTALRNYCSGGRAPVTAASRPHRQIEGSGRWPVRRHRHSFVWMQRLQTALRMTKAWSHCRLHERYEASTMQEGSQSLLPSIGCTNVNKLGWSSHWWRQEAPPEEMLPQRMHVYTEAGGQQENPLLWCGIGQWYLNCRSYCTADWGPKAIGLLICNYSTTTYSVLHSVLPNVLINQHAVI